MKYLVRVRASTPPPPPAGKGGRGQAAPPPPQAQAAKGPEGGRREAAAQGLAEDVAGGGSSGLPGPGVAPGQGVGGVLPSTPGGGGVPWRPTAGPEMKRANRRGGGEYNGSCRPHPPRLLLTTLDLGILGRGHHLYLSPIFPQIFMGHLGHLRRIKLF